MPELLITNSLFVSQLYEGKSLVLRTGDLIVFTSYIITAQQFTAIADYF